VTWGLKTDELLFDCPAATAPKLNMRKFQTAQFIAKAEMAKRNVRMTVYMHPLATLAATLAFWQIHFSLKAVNRSAGCRFPYKSFCIVKPKQAAWNVEEFR
jgi:hypothetical protein